MKNGVECYKDFFPYFKALKTNCAGSPLLTLVLREKFFSSLFSLVPSSYLFFFFYSGRKYGSEFEMLLPSS